MKPLDIIEAPSNLGLKPPGRGTEPGVRHAPGALLRSTFLAGMAFRDRSRVEAPPYQSDDPGPGHVRNMAGIAAYSAVLAGAITRSLRQGRFPLVIGGDCSILLGAGLALRGVGRYGLMFIDGHTDFYLPEQSATGGAAGLDLALATGWGPTALTDIDGLQPYFRTEDVLLMGDQDTSSRPPAAIPTPAGCGMDHWDLRRLRTTGTRTAAESCIAALARRPVEGFWIHLDVDALDDAIMPAVDSRKPGWLSWDEMGGMIGAALGTGRAVGMEITIFDPDLDPDGHVADALARSIAQWFERDKG